MSDLATQEETRAFGRTMARELTPAEIDAVAGAWSQTITCPCQIQEIGDDYLISGTDDGSD